MFNLEKILALDVEANGLINPTKIHVICAKELDGTRHEFRRPLENFSEVVRFRSLINEYRDGTIAMHHGINYDFTKVINRLIPNHGIRFEQILDTLVLSRLLKYNLEGGHSLEAYGRRFKQDKKHSDITDWSEFTEDMVERCHSDCDITMRIVTKYMKYLRDERWDGPIRLENETALICAQMEESGFAFDLEHANDLRRRIVDLIRPIDESLDEAFPPRSTCIREIHPVVTKSGALNMKDFKWFDGQDLSVFNGGPFSRIEFVPFNPASLKQTIERLNEAGWRPTEKTKGHQEATKRRSEVSEERREYYATYGWKVNEENLKTLPETAPSAAKDLAKRIVLSSRQSDLEEWISLAREERFLSKKIYVVHGSFQSIGSWTHRLSHSRPNLANVPVAKRSPKDNAFETLINDFNDEMRSLWVARPGFRLVGTDADGIQMRVFAHYAKDDDLRRALISGSKEDGTDIHTLHQKKLGEICKSRDAAKTFIYAYFLGAGLRKIMEILECSFEEAKEAVENFLSSYPRFKEIKETQIPRDADRGYFEGLDGRYVACNSEHLMMSGYLQNGESIIMKGAAAEWTRKLREERIEFRICTWPHDEWQSEIPDDDDVCRYVQGVQIDAIRNQADRLGLYCPLDGSSSYGYTWKDTH